MVGSNPSGDGSAPRSPLDELQERIGFVFENIELLRRALTHPSYAHETLGVEADNQRLEFLGDAVLGLVVARRLFERYPDQAEGQLSRIKAALVCEDTLASLAEEIDLGRHLLLGRGEQASGGDAKSSILSDAIEALFAAVYLDGGYDAAELVVNHLFEWRIEEAREGLLVFDSKTALQELVQSQGGEPPVYTVSGQSGPPHSRTFTVDVRLGDELVAEGTGPSKKAAQKRAAASALRQLRGGREPTSTDGLAASQLDTSDGDEHDSNEN